MTAPDWLAEVLRAGESVTDAPPDLAADRAAVLGVLRRAFQSHALDVAGPPLAFDADAAFAGAQLLATACWRQAGGDDSPPLTAREPDSPTAHLSGDVCARLLPGVYRRARAAGTALAAELEAALRRWPLAGVLADLDGGPQISPDFGGHFGLQLLYAERLSRAPRTGWSPPPGAGFGLAERVFAERKLVPPAPPPDPA